MPKLMTVTVNYFASVKTSLPGNRFDNSTVGDSETHTYDVSDIMIQQELDTYIAARRAEIKARIDGYVEDGYNEIKGIEG